MLKGLKQDARIKCSYFSFHSESYTDGKEAIEYLGYFKKKACPVTVNHFHFCLR
jgi:hypothetical protein